MLVCGVDSGEPGKQVVHWRPDPRTQVHVSSEDHYCACPDLVEAVFSPLFARGHQRCGLYQSSVATLSSFGLFTVEFSPQLMT